MTFARTALSLVLALQLAACGGGDSSAPPVAVGGGGTPAPTPPPSGCSLRAQQDFADGVLNEWYLFPDLLANANPASFNNLDDYLDARVAPARAANRDRFFTFATSIAQENALINSGSSAGFGIRLSYDDANRRLFVVEAYEGASGLAAGLDRGAEITAIGTTAANLQTVSSLFASGGSQAVANALGPSDPGVTRVLRFVQPGGAIVERSITKTTFALDPVSDRYGALVLSDGARRIGYINLRTFVVADAANQLRAAFGQFASQGVRELIIDLRYNGGGLVDVADTFGDLMGSGRVGQVWSREVLRPSKASQNTTRLFRTEANAIAPTRVAVITTGSSASASELVTNSLIPYLGNNLALVGANSFGKPVGQFGFDLAACDLRVRAVAFQTVNANNQGDYFTGLASVVPNTCRAGDDLARPLGDPREASIAAALDFLAGRACTPITGGAAGDVAGGIDQGQNARQGIDLPDRLPLQPRRPEPAQHELPGLF
ncbi:S41 family peptidase [Porphyrobacter sp. CACIAM 03H1]|uniref:S41 family peptidase n=1 Tax=Porphyrobacter sp. CACIAM 03H1 TaxID=2003315 RepID=UPI000B5A5A66|nr:S41 family peptidase [Porphyrobacter sp. CACIAM 03H1]ASJ90389.1 peptidase S41 [Porphyrobacter sp. CACIAM 03H1]